MPILIGENSFDILMPLIVAGLLSAGSGQAGRDAPMAKRDCSELRWRRKNIVVSIARDTHVLSPRYSVMNRLVHNKTSELQAQDI